MIVSDVMTTGVKTAHADTLVKDLANTMCLNNISGLPIVDENDKIIGIVSEKDLLRQMFPDVAELAKEEGIPDFEDMEKGYSDSMGLVASDLMTTTVSSVTPDMPIMKAASLMCINKIRRIPVAENNKLVGIISIGDVHKAIFKNSMG